LDDTKFLHILLSFYSPRFGITKQGAVNNMMEALQALSYSGEIISN
jgi:hypothetical protein